MDWSLRYSVLCSNWATTPADTHILLCYWSVHWAHATVGSTGNWQSLIRPLFVCLSAFLLTDSSIWLGLIKSAITGLFLLEISLPATLFMVITHLLDCLLLLHIPSSPTLTQLTKRSRECLSNEKRFPSFAIYLQSHSGHTTTITFLLYHFNLQQNLTAFYSNIQLYFNLQCK